MGLTVSEPGTEPNAAAGLRFHPENEEERRSRTAARGQASPGLLFRLCAVCGVLALECVAVAWARHPGLIVGQAMGGPIVFFGALLFFGQGRLRREPIVAGTIGKGFVALHLAALAVLAGTEVYLLRTGTSVNNMPRAGVVVWFCAAAVLGVSLVLAVLPPGDLVRVARALGRAWGYAAGCAALALGARRLAWVAWTAPESGFGQWLQGVTFRGVAAILKVFYGSVVVDPATSTVGTARFQVQVAGGCSGIEGLGLMLVLTVGWMIFARRELRLRRAVWLVPASLAAVWMLNFVRIAALIALGDAGHGDVAVNGFHSEAGWILLNVVALGFLATAQHLRWLRKDAGQVEPVTAERNVAAVYLLPFLAIVAASLVSKAASSGFEGLYWLRLAAAAGVLWWFRAEYRRMDWRFGWLGVTAGAAVFAMWLGLDRWFGGAGGAVTAAGLVGLGGWQRTGWLAARVIAAVVTVPMAEELAFRGYLARRVMAEDVESVSYASLTPVAVLASSAAFGLMHGRMWLAGLAAGVVFAVVAKRRGRLGEAFGAHATANLLIAVWVLARGDYRMW